MIHLHCHGCRTFTMLPPSVMPPLH
ncbi:hypothetical protein J4734_19285 [Klebsiella pneumoniae]|uniref:Uncharacterized protein n=1 Tax=Klebsiella pneumoniae TaxID=573 RepID=A0A939NN91_KLEPN|nr:hypothetical protein [Klebsiella pneumoniae]